MVEPAEDPASRGPGPGGACDLQAFIQSIESIVDRDLAQDEEADIVERLVEETRWLRNEPFVERRDEAYVADLFTLLEWTLQVLKERRPAVLLPRLTEKVRLRIVTWLTEDNAFVEGLPDVAASLRAARTRAAKRANAPDRLGARELFEELMRDPSGPAVSSGELLAALGKKNSSFLNRHTTKPGVPYQLHLLWPTKRGGPPREQSEFWRPSVLRVLADKWLDRVTASDRARLRLLPERPPVTEKRSVKTSRREGTVK